ncbi:MAG: putative LPS assembly protein LptD, partial [Bacteroidota bacterium]
FNTSVRLNHNQNIQTGIVNLVLPDFTFTTSRVFPFKKVIGNANSPLAKLSFSHNMVAQNVVSNAPVRNSFRFEVANASDNFQDTLAFSSENLSAIFGRARLGARHTVPITTSMSVLKYFTLNPSFNYTEIWLPKELRYEYLPDQNAVRVDTVNRFSRAGSWTSGASLNTIIYGTKNFKRGKIKAIRHVMTPSISFSYNPDFTDPRFGVFSEVQIDSLGNTQNLSKYEGAVYGIGGRESQTIGFTLANNIEMKVISKKDTITGTKKIKLFDNLGINTGYNLAADSFKLSNINLNARTSLFNNIISVNLSGTIDPYQYRLNSVSFSSGNRVVDQDRLDRYAWNNGLGLGQFSNARMNIGFSLSPDQLKGKSPANNTANTTQRNGFSAPESPTNFEGLTEQEQNQIAYIQNNPDEYVDFNVPWTLSAQYNISRRKTGFSDAVVTQTLNFNGSLGLTEKTQITFNSGYDLERKELTQTQIGVSRDLHCWTMNFNWVPLGFQQSYFFSIRVKSSLLQDLKVEKRQPQQFFN